MEAVVPQQITAELTQILSNLVLGDNDIRSNAEKAVNERLARTPELYLLALAQFAISADTEVMRSFSLVLLRRLLFRAAPNQGGHIRHPPLPRLTLYDHLSSQTLTTLERLLLHSLSHEPSPSTRRKSVDTICDVAKQAMARGRPWHALQAQTFSMTQVVGNAADGTGVSGRGMRESAYRVFAGCPNLVMDLQTDAVLQVFQKGLQDSESIEVRHAALLASVAYLTAAEPPQLAHSLSLMYPILETIHVLSQSLYQPPLGSTGTGHPDEPSNQVHLTNFLSALTPLCSSNPSLFAPHLQALLSFMPQLILPPVDCGPTPTVGRPFPSGGRTSGPSSSSSIASSSSSSSGALGGGLGGGGGSAFVFPLPGDAPSSFSRYDDDDEDTGNGDNDDDGEDAREKDERAALRLAALEFMVSLSEAKAGMVKRVQGWVEVVVRACLEGMGELDEDERVEVWLQEDPSVSSSDDVSNPMMFEQSLDRLACALGGRAVLPPAFQYIPSMLVSYDWRSRHAGLCAIAAIAEGTGKVMQNELAKIVALVTPMFQDAHPRVRYAACQCIGQLCTDLEEVIQEQYHEQLFPVLVHALEDPEPRVHSHAAAALINFCEGVERETLLPYLDPIVERLLKLLNPGGDSGHGNGSGGGNGSNGSSGGGWGVKRYVQEQAVTTLAMVADCSEATFAKHYPTIMPLLLSVLQNANGAEYQKLRIKAMECAGLIAIAVGKDVFRNDSSTLIELLIRIQKSPMDPGDTQLVHYLTATWGKVCQALGEEFEPYLPVVMPQLLATAAAKADISIYDDEPEHLEEKEGWEIVEMDGQTLGIRTSSIDEKCQAFETLVIYCSTLGGCFAPYLERTLEIALPALKFYFHEGVREAAAMLVPMLIACGKQSNTLTPQIVSASFHQIINCINTEHDSSFLSSLYKCFCDSLLLLGGAQALSGEYVNGVIEATKRQLQAMADRRKQRAARWAAQDGRQSSGIGLGGGGGGGGLMDGDEDDEGLTKDEVVMLEEIEDYALDDIGRMLGMFEGGQGLLVAVGSVRDLGLGIGSEDEGDG